MKYIIMIILLFSLPFSAECSEGSVVINEICWMGTLGGGSGDEWLELHNITDKPISLNGWSIEDESYGEYNDYITGIAGTIPARGYFLIERKDSCIKDISADFLSPSMKLDDRGEKLTLRNENRRIVDVAGRINSPWYAGIKKKPRYTMERTDPSYSGRDPNNWHSNNGIKVNGTDRKGKLISGTPGQANSPVQGIDAETISIKILNSMVPPLMIDYTVPLDSVISIRIYGKDRLVRTLINGERVLKDRGPERTGTQGSCVWDELDAYGERVAPGQYRALLEVIIKGAGKRKQVFSKPIEIKYIPVK